jgi:ribulose-5-phosphate 4-epimerase/fuculose-1-phosphate aldolase
MQCKIGLPGTLDGLGHVRLGSRHQLSHLAAHLLLPARERLNKVVDAGVGLVCTHATMIPRFTRTSDLITTRELGEEVDRTMGRSLACYLLNHGIVVAGSTIDQAVVSAINLERASQVQLLAAASGQPLRWTSDEEIASKREHIFGTGMLRNVWNYYRRRVGPL